MIPKVKTWNVRYYVNGELAESVYVKTINKRFALWEAREATGYRYVLKADKVTVSPVFN